jgi:Leucine-rich repeat (LRR) protein
MDNRPDAVVIEKIEDAKDLKEGLQLDLVELGLVSVPKQILGLRKLRVLNLRSNNLSMLPTEVCETLHDLEFLNLGRNRLQYLPENISSLTHLRTCLLQHNELAELPSGIGRLPLLTELRLDHNLLVKLPDTCGRLASLKVLTLSDNRLEALPQTLVGAKALESLDLHENPTLNFDHLPEQLLRLHEMYGLLHSKAARRKVIRRALGVRPAVRAAVREELLAAEAGGPAATSAAHLTGAAAAR